MDMDIDIIILDTFEFECETIVQVKSQFDYLQVPVSYETLCEHLAKLVREGYLYIAQSVSSEGFGWWYGMTKKGRERWKERVDQVFARFDFQALAKTRKSTVPYLMFAEEFTLKDYLEILEEYKREHPGYTGNLGIDPKTLK